MVFKSIGVFILGDIFYGGEILDRLYFYVWYLCLFLFFGELLVIVFFDIGEVINEVDV